MDVVMTDATRDSQLENDRAMEEETDYIQPVALLMDELKNEDAAVRIESLKRLSTISLALGPERTRLELLPFLLTSLDEEDEVLAVLADEVPSLVDGLGGVEYSHLLLPLLEGLVATEEPYVRLKGVTAFERVLDVLPDERVISEVLPLIQRLANGDWFSKKCSAASLIKQVLVRLKSASIEEKQKGSARVDLLKILSQLALEDMPLVRKAVALNLNDMVVVMDREVCCKHLLPLISQLSSDPQDSVRCHAVSPLATFLSKRDQDQPLDEATSARLVALFLSLVSDYSWRIRFVVATVYSSFTLLAGSKPENVDFIELFCGLLRDPEGEVRSAACSQLSATAACFPDRSLFIESAKVLVADPSPHVRAQLATQLNELARVIGKEESNASIMPLIVQLLNDESSEVRLNIISKLEIILGVVGISDLTSSLLPAIIKLVEDKQWRVRQTIIEYIPDLAMHLGKDFFEAHFKNLSVSWLEDPVYAVRETAIDSVKRLLRQFGSEWASQSGFLQSIMELRNRRNYLKRETLLFLMATSCSSVDLTIVTSVFLPVLEAMGNDSVANVRFNVAKTLESLIPVLLAANQTSILRSPIITILQQLERDSDMDVREYASKALHLIPV